MATVIYTAPEGDDKVVTFMGVEFFAGHPVDLDEAVSDPAKRDAILKKIGQNGKGNPHFSVQAEESAPAPDEGEKVDGRTREGRQARRGASE